MDKIEHEPKTADGDLNVVQSGDKVVDEPQLEEEKKVLTKWKWVCFVAEEVVEGRDELTAGEKASVGVLEGNTGDVKDISTSSGVKRKVVNEETDETPEKKAKVSEDLNNLHLDVQKMEL